MLYVQLLNLELSFFLFVHSKTREAELERTIQELGEALVLARNNGQTNRSHSDSDGQVLEDIASLKSRIDSLRLDLQTANANLSLDRERVRKYIECKLLSVVFLLINILII